jgi:two-component system LytT family response regulator
MHQKIFIKDGEKCHFIPLTDIYFIESLENYARLYFGFDKVMIKRSLNLIRREIRL